MAHPFKSLTAGTTRPAKRRNQDRNHRRAKNHYRGKSIFLKFEEQICAYGKEVFNRVTGSTAKLCRHHHSKISRFLKHGKTRWYNKRQWHGISRKTLKSWVTT